jgi:HK97 family phage prohead protease
MEKKSVNLEVKQFDAESRLLSGYASTFGFPADVQGDVIVKGAFAESIMKIKNDGIPLLDSHKQDSQHVLGTVIDAFEDDHGLYITAKLADTPQVEEIRQKLKQGHINKMSIGFFIGKQHFKQHNGEEFRMIEKANLIEISVVPIPANSRATILSVKNQDSSQEPNAAVLSESEPKVVHEAKEEEVIDSEPCKCGSEPKELQEDGVSAIEATENASDCQTPEGISLEEKQHLETIAELLQQSLNETRRKYNGK